MNDGKEKIPKEGKKNCHKNCMKGKQKIRIKIREQIFEKKKQSIAENAENCDMEENRR